SAAWSSSTMADQSFFFFSSRRRHTRFSRDWSSDVCSSDLLLAQDGDAGLQVGSLHIGDQTPLEAAAHAVFEAGQLTWRHIAGDRSEERRVGKEWSRRLSPEAYNRRRAVWTV